MKKNAFYFELPEHLIAQYPLENRTDSRLLVYHRGTQSIAHEGFRALIDYLEPGDLLVMNNSRVIPARLYGKKPTGGQVELLIERVINDHLFWAHIKASKAIKSGGRILLDNQLELTVTGREDDLFICESKSNVYEMLEAIGHVPLPPYIARSDETMDLTRYQTVYADPKGSVAAPTAGLHFDEALLSTLKEKGVQLSTVTLHVGAGTFRPVRAENILDHQMHKEWFAMDEALCEAISKAKKENKRVIAVGTTALRALESAARFGELTASQGETDIFIYPGFQFKVCDGLLTNFHLPESTLLMLVSAFVGHQEAMSLYQTAIDHQYRFFSYGDTSLLI